MKVIIMAGGFGTRLSEETVLRPKPMVEIGGKPILWHIMNHYSLHNIRHFIIALGYKGDMIKEYFLNYYKLNSDLSLDLATGEAVIHGGEHPDWKVDLVDTGLETLTGGRLGRLERWLGDDQTFMMTYGDGLSDVDVGDLAEFHESHGRLATVTTVRPPARFGSIALEEDRVSEFAEKSQSTEGWINGGFFVLDRGVMDYIESDETSWEVGPLHRLASDGELMGYRHDGFWQPMDTLREKQLLEKMWASGEAPWTRKVGQAEGAWCPSMASRRTREVL